MPGLIYEFAGFTLDRAAGVLRRGERPLELGAPSFAVLAQLVEARGRTVTREELFEVAWPGLHVNDGSLRQAIYEIRQQLGSAGPLLQTLRGKGYRFAGAIALHDASASEVCLPLGREAELARIHTALAAAKGGAGRTLVLTGAPGVGKSTLAQAFEQVAHVEGATTLSGRGTREEGAPPLWPWTEMLRAHFASLPPGAYERLISARPHVQRLLEHRTLALPAAESPAQQRFLLFEELLQLFLEFAEQSVALCVLLDDLHDLDDTSLAFLQRFAREVAQRRIVLLAAARNLPRRANRRLAQTIDALAEGAQGELICVTNLPRAAFAALLARRNLARVGPAGLSELFALTQGNPLFALEVAKIWQRAHEAHAEPPERELALHDVLRRRLGRLAERTAHALASAAVWGHEFSVEELAATLAIEAHEAGVLLEEARGAEIIVALASAGRFRFSHPLWRESALAGLAADERAALHLRAGEHLERQGPDVVEARVHELAYHFHEALSGSAAERAVRYCARAAERCHDATAYGDAVALYERALRSLALIEAGDARLRLRLRLAQTQSMRAAGVPTCEVNASFAALAEAAHTLGDAELEARAALGYAGQQADRFTPAQVGASSDGTEALLLERALASLGARHPELRVLLLSSLAHLALYSHDRERREGLLREALERARRLDDPSLLARVLSVEIALLCTPDDQPRVLPACDELLALSRRTRDRALELETLIWRAIALLSVAERAAAERSFEQAGQLARALGTSDARAQVTIAPLSRAVWEGRLDEAEQLAQQAMELSGDHLQERALYAARVAALQYLRGVDLERGIVLKQTALQVYPHLTAMRCALASDFATLGRDDEARCEFDAALGAVGGGLPSSTLWLNEMSALADAASRLDDPARAQLIYDRLLPFADRVIVYMRRGFLVQPVATMLGMLAVTLRAFGQAEAWFEQALTTCRRLDAPLFEHLTRYEQARGLLVRGAEVDLSRVFAWAHEMLPFARERGVGLLEQRARELLAQCEARGFGVHARRRRVDALRS